MDEEKSANAFILRAKAQARELKGTIAKEWTDISRYPREANPVSVFMAGSPGAGKTESAKRVLYQRARKNSIIHIDPDEVRKLFTGYVGDNAALFQSAVSDVVNRMHDYVLKNGQSFILDGTMSNYDQAVKNIEHSLKPDRNRTVFVLYVYQDPIQAWNFIQARRGVEGRKVPKDAFIQQYFSARATVNQLMNDYAGRVQFEVIHKDIDGSDQAYFKGIASIDECIAESYSRERLEKLI